MQVTIISLLAKQWYYYSIISVYCVKGEIHRACFRIFQAVSHGKKVRLIISPSLYYTEGTARHWQAILWKTLFHGTFVDILMSKLFFCSPEFLPNCLPTVWPHEQHLILFLRNAKISSPGRHFVECLSLFSFVSSDFGTGPGTRNFKDGRHWKRAVSSLLNEARF